MCQDSSGCQFLSREAISWVPEGPIRHSGWGKGLSGNGRKKSFKGAFQIISGVQPLLCLISSKWIMATRINLSSGRKTNYKRLHIGCLSLSLSFSPLLRWKEKTKRRGKKYWQNQRVKLGHGCESEEGSSYPDWVLVMQTGGGGGGFALISAASHTQFHKVGCRWSG